MAKFEIKPSGKTINSNILLDEFNKRDNLPTENKQKVRHIKQQIENEDQKKDPKKEARYYLPVLYLNDPTQWDSKPLSERKHFTDEVAKKTCLSNCCGIEGLRSGCCKLDPDDLEHILGPLDEEWITKILKYFKNKNIPMSRYDVVIDFEEGRLIGQKFFNGHPVFDSKESYPMLRFQIDGNRFSCKFLNANTGMCGIYEQRSDMCRNYLCQYVKKNFLVRTPANPNKYSKVE